MTRLMERRAGFGFKNSHKASPVRGSSVGLRSIAVTSGKGGVGKSSVVANLALILAEMEVRVLVLDGDMGLANIDVLLGLSPQYTLKDFLQGDRNLGDIVLEGPKGMRVLPAGCGIMELTDLSREQRLSLVSEINALGKEHDLLLIDTGAGVSSNVLLFNALAEEIMVVVTPEPASITDAYALIKLMSLKYRRRHFAVLVNEARSEKEANQVFQALNRTVESLLQVSLTELGFLPWDANVVRSVKSQKPFVELFPAARITQQLRKVAHRLRGLSRRAETLGELTFFGPYV